MTISENAKIAKLSEVSKMRSCWPSGSSDVIGAREPRKKDYGSPEPVMSMRSMVWRSIKNQFSNQENRDEAIAVLGVCLVLAIALIAFVVSVPGAIKEAQDHGQQVVAESRGVEER